jgi:hypothetical protein
MACILRGIPGHRNSNLTARASEDIWHLTADNTGIALEDQVDVILFTSVVAMTAYLSHANQAKLAKYPSSLFRIICTRRMSDSLLRFLDSDSNVSGSLPAILVKHNDGDLMQPMQRRPNLIESAQLAVCEMFVSFKPIPMRTLH